MDQLKQEKRDLERELDSISKNEKQRTEALLKEKKELLEELKQSKNVVYSHLGKRAEIYRS